MSEIIIVDSDLSHKQVLESALVEAGIEIPCIGFVDTDNSISYLLKATNESQDFSNRFMMINLDNIVFENHHILRTIRERIPKKSLTIIGYSNRSLEQNIAPAYQNGADLYMFLESSFPELVELIRNVFYFLRNNSVKALRKNE